MNNKLAILAALLIASGAFAQKDELKTLKKIYDKEQPSEKDVAEFKLAVAKAETFTGSASEGDKVLINYYKAQIPSLDLMLAMSKPENANNPMIALKFFDVKKIEDLGAAYADMKAYEKKTGKNVYTKDIDEELLIIGPMIREYAIGLGKQNKYAEGGRVLYSLYQMDQTNMDNLFYAASYAVNGQDYDRALQYYNQLKDAKYTGEGVIYYATNIATNVEETFPNKTVMNEAVKLKTYKNPREEKIPSKRGEIYKNVALILVQKNKTDEAKAAFAEAIRENPDDASLQINEADLYLKLNDNETYKQKVAKILEKNPNDVDLVYNLGVVTMQAGNDVEAENYFKKALQLNPNHVNSLLNLTAIKLKADEKLVNQMNSITGTSDKENKRYDALKKEREVLFRSVMPYLEKVQEVDPANEAATTNLLSVYRFLEMTDKYNALKAKKTNK